VGLICQENLQVGRSHRERRVRNKENRLCVRIASSVRGFDQCQGCKSGILEAMRAQGLSEEIYKGAHSARMDEEKHPLAAMSGLC